MTDNVTHPAHYTSGGIEAKDALRAAMDGSELSPMAFYWWGCAFKYLWRWSRENRRRGPVQVQAVHRLSDRGGVLNGIEDRCRGRRSTSAGTS